MDVLISWGIFLFLITLAFLTGTLVEKFHYKDITRREKELLPFPAVTFEKLDEAAEIIDCQLVTGSVVISLDYFKRFLASLRNIVGGRVKSYETLLDRGRREALLRMREKARKWGADMVVNVRFQTATIGRVRRKNQGLGCFEVLAYGTAIKLKK